MGKFTEIVVRFTDQKAGGRMRAVVLPDTGVDAIFLGGSENTPGAEKLFPKGKTTGVRPDQVTLESDGALGNVALSGGPDQVCYLVNGRLHCWGGS
jgi:hypothetical protein